MKQAASLYRDRLLSHESNPPSLLRQTRRWCARPASITAPLRAGVIVAIELIVIEQEPSNVALTGANVPVTGSRGPIDRAIDRAIHIRASEVLAILIDVHRAIATAALGRPIAVEGADTAGRRISIAGSMCTPTGHAIPVAAPFCVRVVQPPIDRARTTPSPCATQMITTDSSIDRAAPASIRAYDCVASLHQIHSITGVSTTV